MALNAEATKDLQLFTWEDIESGGPNLRAAWLRGALEMLRAVQCHTDEGYMEPNQLRAIAKELELPFVFLTLEYSLDRSQPRLTANELNEWAADTDAQRVFSGWVAEHAPDEGQATAEVTTAESRLRAEAIIATLIANCQSTGSCASANDEVATVASDLGVPPALIRLASDQVSVAEIDELVEWWPRKAGA